MAFEARPKKTRPSLVYCGDDQSAKDVAAKLIHDLGFDPVDGGPLQIARYTEPFALLVAQLAYEGQVARSWRTGSSGFVLPAISSQDSAFSPQVFWAKRQSTGGMVEWPVHSLSEKWTKGELEMEIKKVGSQPSAKGPSEWFTGTVRIDPLFQAPDPAFVQGASVTFEPGARTAWHTHPLGQTLIVTAGCGWVQRKGGPIEEIRPGDVVCFSPGEKHWHGATPTTAMTHIAIQEKLDGKVVDWMEQVSDEQYRK